MVRVVARNRMQVVRTSRQLVTFLPSRSRSVRYACETRRLEVEKRGSCLNNPAPSLHHFYFISSSHLMNPSHSSRVHGMLKTFSQPLVTLSGS